MKARERGSALFIILIGVALFAALSYTVSLSMRGSNPDALTEEKSNLYAGEILNYARSLRQAAQKVKISNSCGDLSISFESPVVAGYTHTPATTESCMIFNAAGGGMNYASPPEDWLGGDNFDSLRSRWFFPARVCVPGTGRAEAGCNSDGIDNEALVAILPLIKKDICIELNNLLGIDNPGGEPPGEIDDAWIDANTKFAGSQSDGTQIDMPNRMAGCFEGSGSDSPPAGTYHFFQILLAR